MNTEERGIIVEKVAHMGAFFHSSASVTVEFERKIFLIHSRHQTNDFIDLVKPLPHIEFIPAKAPDSDRVEYWLVFNAKTTKIEGWLFPDYRGHRYLVTSIGAV